MCPLSSSCGRLGQVNNMVLICRSISLVYQYWRAGLFGGTLFRIIFDFECCESHGILMHCTLECRRFRLAKIMHLLYETCLSGAESAYIGRIGTCSDFPLGIFHKERSQEHAIFPEYYPISRKGSFLKKNWIITKKYL